MTPREQVETALQGGHGSKVPFTIYECMIPQCSVERELRNRGLCIVKRDIPVYKIHRPNVKVTQHVHWEGERKFVRTYYETPVGTLSTLKEDAGFTDWYLEKMFKKPEDYKRLLFMIQDECYEPNYEEFKQAEKSFGHDAIFRTHVYLEPLQELITGEYMSTETFCIEWMDNRDEILKLYHAIVENRRKTYPLIARSPASHTNYGGNVIPEITGIDIFEKYYVDHYNEAAEIMHKHGKLIGCHFDGNCKLFSNAIAGTKLDYIEAFTPAPDTDMTLAEARDVWHDKVLWINFPSSIHVKSDEEVTQATIKLLEELKSVDGFIIGITEDMPPYRWQNSCKAIMNGIERHARENPALYL